jgi:protein-S-isoprenylcysteine O-methyltransferase Ste14
MATSRSTPRLRLTVLLLAALVALVAVSERTAAAGLPGLLLQLFGLACVGTAALGRVWTSLFIAGYKDARLVQHGPYALLRHPLYLLSLLAMLGAGLTTRSLAITAVLLLVFAAIHLLAARAEERFLREQHGAAFERYASSVPAFLPRLAAQAIPDLQPVRPRVLAKAFVDAGSLLGLWMLLVVADALQRGGITPTWVTLP